MSSAQLHLIETSPTQEATDAITARLLELGRPDNTRLAYRKQWTRFEAWCEDPEAKPPRHYRPLPAAPGVVIEYLAAGIAAGLAFRTLKQIRAAIRDQHRRKGFPDPNKDLRVREFWKGYLIEHERPENPTLGVTRRGVEMVVDAIDKEVREAGPFASPRLRLAAARDKALVLLIYHSELTRAEVASLLRENVARGPRGLKIRVERSKDRGRDVDVEYDQDVKLCPVRALGGWFRLTSIEDGHALRGIDQYGRVEADGLSEDGVKYIWRRRAGLAGLDTRLVTVRSLRDGKQKQSAYEGKTDAELLKAAGLNEESRVNVNRRVQPARDLREQQREIPTVL